MQWGYVAHVDCMAHGRKITAAAALSCWRNADGMDERRLLDSPEGSLSFSGFCL